MRTPSPSFASSLLDLLVLPAKTEASHHWKVINRTKSPRWTLEHLTTFRSETHGGDRLSAGLDDVRSDQSTQQLADTLWGDMGLGNAIEPILEEPAEAVGAPHFAECRLPDGDRRHLNYHDLMLSFIASRIVSTTQQTLHRPRSILEIGGGYGGLARKLALLAPEATLTLVDLPEGAVLQAFYLASHFGEHEVQLHADDLAPSSGRFRILRAGTESNLKFERFDLIVNCRSLMEMSQLQINQYFSLIHNVCPVGGCFYNLNRYLKTSNGYRNAIGRYPYDPRWNILGVAPSPLQPQLLELVTSRTSRPNPFFGPFLLTIPRSNLWWDRSLGTALEAISPLGHRLLLRDLPRFASRTRRLVRRALRREGPTISRSAGWTST